MYVRTWTANHTVHFIAAGQSKIYDVALEARKYDRVLLYCKRFPKRWCDPISVQSTIRSDCLPGYIVIYNSTNNKKHGDFCMIY